jgi:hypothetical protein
MTVAKSLPRNPAAQVTQAAFRNRLQGNADAQLQYREGDIGLKKSWERALQ